MLLRSGILGPGPAVGPRAGFSGLHPQALAAYNLMVAAGVTPTDASLSRLSTAYQILDAAGILGNLADGVWFSTDWQGATGTPRDLGGAAAASFADGFTRSAWGLSTTQATTSGIGFTVPSVSSGTMMFSHTPNGVNGDGIIGMLSNSANANDGHRVTFDGTNTPRLSNYVAGAFINRTPTFANGAVSRHTFPLEKQPRISGYTYGVATPKIWVDGIEATLSPNEASAASSATLNRWSFFRLMAASSTWSSVAAFIRRGTTTAGWLFNKELSTTEARAATMAMAALEPTTAVMVQEGDSTCESLLHPTRNLDDWGHKFSDLSGTGHIRRVNIATSGHAILGYDATYGNWDNQAAHWLTSGIWQRKIFTLQGGINDFGLGLGSPAAVYAAGIAYLNKAKAAGAETMWIVAAPPILNGGLWTTTMRDNLAALRDLVVAGHANGDFNHIVRGDLILPHDGSDNADWFDFAHPNGSGNAKIAAAVKTALNL